MLDVRGASLQGRASSMAGSLVPANSLMYRRSASGSLSPEKLSSRHASLLFFFPPFFILGTGDHTQAVHAARASEQAFLECVKEAVGEFDQSQGQGGRKRAWRGLWLALHPL